MFLPKNFQSRCIGATKSVLYFGESVEIPHFQKFVATDPKGDVWSYTCKPVIYPNCWRCLGGTASRIGKIEFEGDWQDSLMVINQHVFYD